MQIDKIVAAIRHADIGKVMYKARPSGNYLGVFGLKKRPSDEEFLQTGTLEDVGFAPVVNQAYKRFRLSIPKDFVILAYPESFHPHENGTVVRNQYQMVDLDIYTYLVAMQAVTNDKLLIESSNYNSLFYMDGRLVDYTKLINENLFNYSFILTDYSPLIPYIYKKQSPQFFADDNVEDILFNVKCNFENLDIKMNFDSLQLLSNIASLPT